MVTIENKIAQELKVSERQIVATVELLDEGATVPFIARYRKEVTGGLDDTQLRTLEERLKYLRELEDRRSTVLKSIEEQGKLTDELKEQIMSVETRSELEDLYLPYRPKRRTKATIAKEAGLEPLAIMILEDPTLDPKAEAIKFANPEQGFNTEDEILEGARQILMEKFAEEAGLISQIREILWENGIVSTKIQNDKKESVEATRFQDYFEYSEAISKIPSHRALAFFRGRSLSFLNVNFDLPESMKNPNGLNPIERKIAVYFNIEDKHRPADSWLLETAQKSWRLKISIHLETDLMGKLWDIAETEAIKVFGENVRALLLAAPAGPKTIMGIDPGIRTGCKIAVVDDTGRVLVTQTIYPFQPKNEYDKSMAMIAALCLKCNVELIAIGNGTASRETEKLVSDTMTKYKDIRAIKVIVSEAGASVYSASAYASKELPNLDVTLRGAVSIARRLQDPLAELVKIEPKSIGVGQYQHDVSASKLENSLDGVVEDCVNAVGVDLNTASQPLLTRISGLNKTLAQNIVDYRDENGKFNNRDELKNVPRLGPKAFEQSAGFLRIIDGSNPLDTSCVHPEAYIIVNKIIEDTKIDIKHLIGNTSALNSLDLQKFTNEQFGLPTIRDIVKELDKPARDPRGEFVTAKFIEGVNDIKDLKVGTILEGQVTNVANFGAFVDIGVHQDGLVHISSISDKFITDPREAVKVGEIVKVKVLDVDIARKRISLTMRLDEEIKSHEERMANNAARRVNQGDRNTRSNQQRRPDNNNRDNRDNRDKKRMNNNPMADALSKLIRK